MHNQVLIQVPVCDLYFVTRTLLAYDNANMPLESAEMHSFLHGRFSDKCHLVICLELLEIVPDA